jgi:hypothetical protein
MDPVAEAHLSLTPVKRIIQPAPGILFEANGIQHVQELVPVRRRGEALSEHRVQPKLRTWGPALVDATTRAAKVDVLRPWSETVTR